MKLTLIVLSLFVFMAGANARANPDSEPSDDTTYTEYPDLHLAGFSDFTALPEFLG